jgi:hypothetical protein
MSPKLGRSLNRTLRIPNCCTTPIKHPDRAIPRTGSMAITLVMEGHVAPQAIELMGLTQFVS